MTDDLFPSGSDSPPDETAPPGTVPEEGTFRIGEVCRLTSTKAFVLRYWETEFPMLAPHKNPKGHRLYRRQDIDTVFEIKRLLYEKGFTIAGARRWLESRGLEGSEAEEVSMPALPAGSIAARKFLVDLEQELRAILTLLESR